MTATTRDRIKRRVSQIEDALARPAQEGPQWAIERQRLERELDWLRAQLA